MYVCIILQISNKVSYFRIQKKQFKFYTCPYINNAKFVFIFNVRLFLILLTTHVY